MPADTTAVDLSHLEQLDGQPMQPWQLAQQHPVLRDLSPVHTLLPHANLNKRVMLTNHVTERGGVPVSCLRILMMRSNTVSTGTSRPWGKGAVSIRPRMFTRSPAWGKQKVLSSGSRSDFFL